MPELGKEGTILSKHEAPVNQIHKHDHLRQLVRRQLYVQHRSTCLDAVLAVVYAKPVAVRVAYCVCESLF